MGLSVETELAQTRRSHRRALGSAVAWKGVCNYCGPGTSKDGSHPAGRRPLRFQGSQLTFSFPRFLISASWEQSYIPNSDKFTP